MINYGIKIERQIIETLNGKKVGELSKHWQGFVSEAFETFSEDDVLYAGHDSSSEKQDIVLILRGNVVKVVVRSEIFLNMHEETLEHFCKYMGWLGISEKSITFFRYYHFGDGTLDGTGEHRLSSAELYNYHKTDVEAFNKEVNDPKVLSKFITRFLNFGTPIDKRCPDYLYYGGKDRGVYCDYAGLYNYALNKEYEELELIHFGPLVYAPSYRGLKFNDPNITEKEKERLKHDKKRLYICIKWPRLFFDLQAYMKSLNDKGIE